MTKRCTFGILLSIKGIAVSKMQKADSQARNVSECFNKLPSAFCILQAPVGASNE